MAGPIKTWAFVVGINDYPEQAKQGALKGAVADAADFADWALHANGGNVAPERLFFWTHPAPDTAPGSLLADYLKNGPTPWWDLDKPGPPDFDRAPTVSNVAETALEEASTAKAAAMQSGAVETRRCYVFFAGHGVQTHVIGSVADPQTCFVLRDFRPNRNTVMGLIPCLDFKRALLAAGFNEVFMFLDCCRVQVTKLDMPAPSLASANSSQPAKPIFVIGSATQMDELGYETEAEPIRGAFSKTLMTALRTLRRGPDQVLTVENLRSYVNENIGAACYPNEQNPSFKGNPDNPWPHFLQGPPTGLGGDGEAAKAPPDSAPTGAPLVVEPLSVAGREGDAFGDINIFVEAPIRINFTGLPVDAKVQVVDDKGAPVGEVHASSGGEALVMGAAGRLYAADLVGTETSVPFKLGPGGFDVRF